MDKIIRCTITITLTETWTMVWAPDDAPLGHPVPIVQDDPATQAEPDENLQAAITTVKPGYPRANEPTAALNPPAAALDPQPGRVPTSAAASRQRPRRRRTGSNPRRNATDSIQKGERSW